MQATQEGLVPLKAWVKSALDHVTQVYLGEPDLEFVWVGDDAINPLQQAQTLNILVTAGIEDARRGARRLGLAPEGGESEGLGKFNPYHDPSNGQFTTAAGAGGASVLYVAASADDKYKYSVNFREEDEKYGGHTLKKHVGRTKQSLIESVDATLQEIPTEGGVISQKIRSESSFVSLESANDLVNRVLQNHTTEVDWSLPARGIINGWRIGSAPRPASRRRRTRNSLSIRDRHTTLAFGSSITRARHADIKSPRPILSMTTRLTTSCCHRAHSGRCKA